jgi:glutamine amidotransferase
MIGIIRYGAGNIFSLTATLERLGIAYGMVHTEADFEQFDRYIIPGVGHAGAAMQKLQSTGLVPTIKALNKPLWVFAWACNCLPHSEEGDAEMLNIFPVKTLRFPNSATFKVPHTGWNQVYPEKEKLFENIPTGSHFYFVHSYFIEYDPLYTLSSTTYINKFSASIWQG